MILQGNRTLWIGGGVAALSLGLYLSLYRPLLGELRTEGARCRALESEVAQARALIAGAKTEGAKRNLISEEQISLAIEELTLEGRTEGINFVSIAPGSIRKPEGEGYRILPIELETESTYQALGEFLGWLDELKRSLMKVQAFNVTGKSEDASQLSGRLTVYLYLVEGSQGG